MAIRSTSSVDYDRDGLVPCVVQDWASGEVLTLAYMNELALRRTRDTGELHLWSRSRDELWHKGATSGNAQAVRALRVDCDGDALLALVEPAGPACHTGERTCFHRGELEPGAPHETLPALERTLRERARERPARLLHGRAARRPAADRREGDGGGRGGRARRARGVRRARRRRGRRRPLPPARAAAQPRTCARGRRAGARWPSLLAPPGRGRLGASAAAVAIEPSLEEARELAGAYNLIPLRTRFIEDCETPVSAFLKLRALAPGEPAFLLESAEQGQRVGRYSFIGFRPRAVLRWSLGDGGDPYALAAERGRRCRQAPMPDDAPPFTGGAVGFFGYDLVRTVEPLGEPSPDPLGLPDMALMLTDALVVFDHLKHTVTILANADLDAEPDLERAYARRRSDDRRSAQRLAGPVPRASARTPRRARRRRSSRT